MTRPAVAFVLLLPFVAALLTLYVMLRADAAWRAWEARHGR